MNTFTTIKEMSPSIPAPMSTGWNDLAREARGQQRPLKDALGFGLASTIDGHFRAVEDVAVYARDASRMGQT